MMNALIKAEHHYAELERLRAGYDGCGCSDCQELYSTLNLSTYGNRVIELDGIYIITAGKASADLWHKYHKPDFWTVTGDIFVTWGLGWKVSPAGKTVCIGAVDKDGKPLATVSDTPDSSQDKREVVSIILTEDFPKGFDIQIQTKGIMKQRGRPKKQGEVSRVTVWRRQKEKATQGMLL